MTITKKTKALVAGALFYAFFMMGVTALRRYKDAEHTFLGGHWGIEFLVMLAAGIAIGYTTSRAAGYTERKNERWRKRRAEQRSNHPSVDN